MVYAGIQNNQTTDVEVNGYLAENSSACNKSKDNTMGFFFITNAGEGGTTPEDLCKNKTCPEGYSCTHGICMSDIVPGFGTGYLACKEDSACKECQYCINGYCSAKDNGSICAGGSCLNGYCIAQNTCTKHSECERGFFCEISLSPNQCVKADFAKIYLNEIDEFIYVSKRSVGFDNLQIEPNTLCELNGFSLISQEHFLSEDFLNTFASQTNSGVPFLTQGGRCHNDGECWSDFSHGYIICVDKK
ncbi:MAG: hypothetical protein J6V11_04190, partial [Alphaproteobacteria bacterium]|nr:hypothetical protein [Alphaproteobacteria bacterium]